MVFEIQILQRMLLVPAALICSVASSAHGANLRVYYNNFDNPEYLSSGVAGGLNGYSSIQSSENFAGRGNGTNRVSGNFLVNGTGDIPSGIPAQKTYITFTGLPSHTGIDLNFLFAAIDTWDGGAKSDSVFAVSDLFNVTVDGTNVFRETFSNITLSNQSYQPPVDVLVKRGAMGGGSSADSLWDLGLDESKFGNIPHTSSTLTIAFYASGSNWNGAPNEYWAIDNVEVVLRGAAVPEASALISTGLFVGLMAGSVIVGTAKRSRLSSILLRKRKSDSIACRSSPH